jgi:tetratricopeptide (TPR) repeat protein
MTYKHARYIVLCAVFLLGACANINPFASAPSAPEQQSVQDAPIQNAENDSPTLDQGEEAVKPVNKELQSALALMLSPNRFTQSRNKNSGSTKQFLLDALSAYQNKEYERALDFIEQAKARPEPLNSSAYVLIGDIYLALWQASKKSVEINTSKSDISTPSDFDLAASSFDSALSLNKHNYKAANRRAMLYREQGKFDKALALYSQAIDAYGGYALSYRNRGVLQDLYLGNKTAALQDYAQYEALLEAQLTYAEKAAVPNMQADAVPTEDTKVIGLASIDDSLSREFSAPSVLKKQLAQVRRWQIDLERQIRAKG